MTSNPADPDLQLRPCPACGNQSPLGKPECVHCGASLVEAVASHSTDASAQRFVQALFTRSNPFTMIFIGINVGVFVLMCLAGGFAVTSVNPQVLLGFGAKQNTLIAEQHQYWRMITSIFIHIGIIHLFLNNYALWIIGQEIERIYGSARFVVLYLATGIVGSIGSYVFNPHATSAGASGSIFGLFGVMAAFAFRYRKEIPEFLSRDIKRRVLPVIAINLIFGFSVQIVDNAAHLGGLASGIVLALIVSYKRPDEKLTPLIWRALQVTCLAVILTSFVEAFRGYSGPRLSLANIMSMSQSDHSAETYFNNMRDASRSLSESFKIVVALPQAKDKASDARRAADAIEQGTQYANSAPRFEGEAERFRKTLLELLDQQKYTLSGFEQTQAKDLSTFEKDERALVARYSQFLAEYNLWIPEFMNEHGYELAPGGR